MNGVNCPYPRATLLKNEMLWMETLLGLPWLKGPSVIQGGGATLTDSPVRVSPMGEREKTE